MNEMVLMRQDDGGMVQVMSCMDRRHVLRMLWDGMSGSASRTRLHCDHERCKTYSWK
jgi:hypothetical protein